MRATRPRRTTAPTGIALGLCALIGFGALACGGSTPSDMWITRDPDAGSGFEPPMEEVQPEAAGSGGAAGDMGTGGTGGDTGAGGAGGTGGDTGAAGAGGTGGVTGAGGAAGTGGGAGAGTSGTGGTST
jgi:hypothetical protein